MNFRRLFFLPLEDSDEKILVLVGPSPAGSVVALWKHVITFESPNFDNGDDAAESRLTLESCGSFTILGNNSAPVMKSMIESRWAKEQSKREVRARVISQMNAARTSRFAPPSVKDVSTQTAITLHRNPTVHESKTTLGLSLLTCCYENLSRLRPVYSDVVDKIAMLLFFTSAKTYNILRQVLTLPSVSTIYREFGAQLEDIRCRLTDLSNVEQSICALKDEVQKLRLSGGAVNIQFTLAVDAFSFRSFSGSPLGPPGRQKEHTEVITEGEVKYNNGFVFLLISHDYRIPVKMVHLAAAPTGCYNKTIASCTDTIIALANKHGLRVWCRATDGGRGVSSEHNSFYKEHIEGRSARFMTLIERVHAHLSSNPESWIPISDPLHVFKNARAHLLTYPMQLYPDSKVISVDVLRQVLDLGDALDDVSQLGKMRDCYVLSLFTFANVQKLLCKEKYVEAYFLLPFACWSAVIFSQSIDLNFRIFLVELSFQIFSNWLGQYKELEKSNIALKYTKDCAAVVFCEAHFVKRMLNTLVAFGVALSFGAENIRLDALGTHLVENQIGIARSTSNDPRYQRILSTFTHAELRKQCASELNLCIHVQGRLNSGGCKVDPDYAMSGPLIAKPQGWRVDAILQLFHGLSSEKIAPALKSDVKLFTSQLSGICSQLDRHVYGVNETANATIMARLIKFNK